MVKIKKLKLYKREKINLYLKNPLLSENFLNKVLRKNEDNPQNNTFTILTNYSEQLKEKRKIKIIYGITEKKFKIYYKKAKKSGEDIFKNILRFLECRLDNIVYRSGLAVTRSEAKQIISHNFIKVNNKNMRHSSKIINIGDYISYNFKKNNFPRKQYFLLYISKNLIPKWIFFNKNTLSFYLKRKPDIEEINSYISEINLNI